MKTSIIGMGEVGTGLYNILSQHYDTKAIDITSDKKVNAQIMHICIPYSNKFVRIVSEYAEYQKPRFIVIHSSVPVGVTQSVSEETLVPTFHSPIRGQHPDMEQGIRTYLKYISYDNERYYEALDISSYFQKAGVSCKVVSNTQTTELMKLLELCRYGVYIAFAKEQEAICDKFGLRYQDVVTPYEETRTNGLKKLGNEKLSQPILYPFKDYVGGHCTVEDMELMLNQVNAPLLKQAYDIDRNVKIWGANVYPSAKLGKGVSIGYGCEIGNNVVIGNGTRIGAMCFIPEGVTIEEDVFIGPKVSFSNDKYPPSSKQCWGKVLVKKKASIGLGAIILPDVIIGEGAIIGAGAVVTKSVPDGETWYGVPATQHGVKRG